MKTKTIALSLILSFGSFGLFAQTDTIPQKDSIPFPKDTMTTIDTSQISIATNANANLIAFTAVRDTVPTADTTGTDTTTTTDSTMAFNNANANFVAFNFVRDTVPTTDTTGTDTTSTTNGTMAFNNANANFVAFNFIRDTVPTTDTTGTDTTSTDSTMASTYKLNHMIKPQLNSKHFIMDAKLSSYMKHETAEAEVNKKV